MTNQPGTIAPTPPIGWSSWNRFHIHIGENLAKDIADALIESGMREAGYVYLNLDDGWMARSRDDDGKLVPDPEKFPEGMAASAEYLHARGLRLGLYGDGGTMTCQRFPGNLRHEPEDAELYASWGVDYFKEDWCYSEGLDKQEKFTLMLECLDATDRSIVFSICTASFPGPWAPDVGHLWRTTRDINNNWSCIPELIDLNSQYAEYAGPGHWNDPDMLPVGNGGLTGAESRSHFGMWCMMTAPLVAGNDLRSMDEEALRILKAPELIAVDQDELGIQGARVKSDGDGEVWAKPLKDDRVAVALFNRGESPQRIAFTWGDVGLSLNAAGVRDLWDRRDLGSFDGGYDAVVDAHDTEMLCVYEIPNGHSGSMPQAPIRLRCEGMESPVTVLTEYPWFKWSSPSLDLINHQSAYQIEVIEVGDAASSSADKPSWDSGRRESLDPWMRYDGPALKHGATYRWRVRIWDTAGNESPYSDPAEFRAVAEERVVPSQPGNPNVAGSFPPLFSWQFESPAPVDLQTSYRLLVSEYPSALDESHPAIWDTGWRYSTQTRVTYGGQGLISGVEYFWKVATKGHGRVASLWSDTRTLILDDAPGPNLLTDGGYEAGGFGWHGIEVTDQELIHGDGHTGTTVLEMRTHNRWGRETYQDVAVDGGKSYVAETWLRFDDVLASNIRFTLTWLTRLPAREAPLDKITVHEDSVPTQHGHGWVRSGGEFRAPEGATIVRFCITLMPSVKRGRVWVDDNRFVDTDATYKTTS